MKSIESRLSRLEGQGGEKAPLVPIPMRDYFAAAALTAMIGGALSSLDGDVVAESCYRFADAMMKARDKSDN